MTSNEASQQEIVPNKIWVHDKFTAGLVRDFDIALIKLSRGVRFNAFVQTVCLPNKNEGDQAIPTTYGTMGGWGATRALRLGERPSPQDSSKILCHAVLQIQSNQLCTNKTAISYNATITFCAGDGKGKSDTSQRDSGGPFVREIRGGR